MTVAVEEDRVEIGIQCNWLCQLRQVRDSKHRGLLNWIYLLVTVRKVTSSNFFMNIG